jgi:hypothetical protein
MLIELADKFVTLTAKRGAGKTQLLKYLIRKNRHHFKEIFIITPSAFNGDYDGVVPKANILTEYSEQWVENLMQKMATKNKGKTKDTPGFTRVMLVLDDVVSSEIKAHNSKTLRTLAARGRHLGLCLIQTAQYYKSIAPIHRQNSDLIFFGKNNTQGIDCLFEEYSMGDMNANEFRRFVIQNTEDYHFLVINNSSKSSRSEDVYATIKAPNVK